MPRLQSFSIDYCWRLIKLPEELWSLPDLRNVVVSEPSKEMEDYLAGMEMKDGCKLTII